eukprot:c20799_g3_i1.p1 GENE.c20799_g3_i1~~c20799_g3_i1.p1  ORF type:complete len:1755 (-),score=536.14 c20799_g3_i1:28-4776(-)
MFSVLHDTPQGLTSRDQLWDLLIGTSFRPLRRGRYFVAVSLREAETLRKIIQGTRAKKDTLLSGKAMGTNCVAALRMVQSEENMATAMLDDSFSFPDYRDPQLIQSSSILRFLDSQTYYGDEDLSLLIKALQNNTPYKRQLQYEQLLKSRRRKREDWRATPLGVAINCSSEFDFINSSALSILIDLKMGEDSLSITEAFTRFDRDNDHALDAGEMFCALEWLGLRPTPQQVYMWMKAADLDGNMQLSFKEFTEFIRQTRVATLGAVRVSGPAQIATPVAAPTKSKRRASQFLLEDNDEEPVKIDREYIEQRQAELNQFIVQQQEKETQERETRGNQAQQQYAKLVEEYQIEEEKEFGPNPSIENDVIFYNFQRQNLPRLVEFHGQPDYAPETDKRFKGKQHFVLDTVAFFLLAPLPGLEDRIAEYSITMHIRAPDFAEGVLFSVVQDEDELEGDVPPTIMLADHKIKASISTEKPKVLINELRLAKWQMLTVVVNLKVGKIVSYITGEKSVELEDPKIFNPKGPFALNPKLGIMMLKQDDTRESDIGIRFIQITPHALTHPEVRKLHSQYGMWMCPRKCRPSEDGFDPCNTVDSDTCWNCGERRKKKGEVPLADCDSDGVVTVVADNFEKKIVEAVNVRERIVLLLVYSPSNFLAQDRLEPECRKLSRVLRGGAPVVVSMMNSDENELEDKHAKLMPEGVENTPMIMLWRKDKPVVVYEKNYELGDFLEFLQEHVPTFDFGRYMQPYVNLYWETKQLSYCLNEMKGHLLRWMSESSSNSPLRLLSMYLSDSNNFKAPVDEKKLKLPEIPKVEASEFAVAEGQKALPFHSKELLAHLIAEVSYSQDRVDPEKWGYIGMYKANHILEDMVCELARRQPANPGAFLSTHLLQTPIRIGSDTLPNVTIVHSRNQQPMLQSEVIKSWPQTREAVIEEPKQSETQAKILRLLGPLLERGLPIDVMPFGYTMLYMAAAQGNLDLVKFLFAHKANLHTKSKDGTLPIEIAASMGNFKVVEFLVKWGSYFGRSIHFAAATGQVRVVEFLIKQGVNVDLFDEMTPLELSIIHGHRPITGLLLQNGANLNRVVSKKLQNEFNLTSDKRKKQDGSGPLPVDLARRVKQTAIYRFLSPKEEQMGMETNVVAHMHDQLAAGITIEPSVLLPGMDINALDTRGWSPLMHSAMTNDGPLAEALLKAGASPHTRNAHGFSAMMWATWCDSHDVLEVLKKTCGENILVLDSTDQAGLEHLLEMRRVAKKNNDQEVLSLLDTSKFGHKSVPADSVSKAESSFATKQEEFGNTGHAEYEWDEADVPSISLEEFLIDLSTNQQVVYPGGPWERDIVGFLNSCKVFVQNVLASQKCPETIKPVDAFVLHIYTRSDCQFFSKLNLALRENNRKDIEMWKPFSWRLDMALRRLRACTGIYYRGVKRFFACVPNKLSYVPGEIVEWGAFTSSSQDHRVAANFMFGGHVDEDTRGVVFKIWGSSPVGLKMFSFFPEEEEFLFAPNSMFKVINWYKATDANVRRSTASQGKSRHYLVESDDIVQPVPLQLVRTEKDLDSQWASNPVILIEMKEVLVKPKQDDGYEEGAD